MPELPEIETIVRGLQEKIIGKTVKNLQVLDPLITLPKNKVVGKRISAIERIGKYIVFHLAPHGSLIFHLRMSGKIMSGCPAGEMKHSRLVLHLDTGVLWFINPRRLGTVEFSEDGFPHALGPDPTTPEFTPRLLQGILAASRSPVKTLIMDQRKISGLGNIYASEALWRAGIDPRRAANSLNTQEASALHRGIVNVLEEAINHMGTTFSDYHTVDGGSGSFQNFLAVYGKAGGACPRCGGEIERITQSGRSTYFCPGCQT
jgi:formamidopyrimidine-DNA glycosylase